MSMSELSDTIEQSSSSLVDVTSSATSTFGHSVAAGVFIGTEEHSNIDTFANNQIAMGRRSALNLGVNKYTLNGGYEFSYTGGDDVHQMRVAFYYQDADFNAAQTSGFNSPLQLGIDFGVHVLVPVGELEFFYGGRLTTGMFSYEFDTPILVGVETFEGDHLNYFGMGVPAGVKMNVGMLTLEAVAAPTLYFHSFKSMIGFDNDLTFLNWAVPVTVSAGVNW
jgi:hypothetical protein